ncbi:hypothetical protein [Photorhabdus australis]|uniref:hypothetical protein n=1 Tax=Photorhabdus australis TaxID=286156 RepID=UPI00068BB8CE|nr:hypothetical protein [Photorhabdus australis]
MKNNVFILESLLKVFDANYADEEQTAMIDTLDVNNSQDLEIACNILLKEDYLSYTDKEKNDFLLTMDYFLSIPEYDFDIITDNFSFIFNNRITDSRVFISNIRDIIYKYSQI